MTGRFILSFDFELMWGVRDHRSVADYGDAVLGVRRALPAMLARFRQHRIRATWATVGLLFARTRHEMHQFAPPLRPDYADQRLSPYRFLDDGVGADESSDPWHFGRSLLDQIADTEGQEIASHTFSHFYCQEPGATLAAFDADLAAAMAIAGHAGHRLRSLVFPRNQMTAAHVARASALGITAYRGNPDHFAYRARPGRDTTLAVRAVRLIDSILPVAGRLDFAAPAPGDSAANVPASRFLRPWTPRHAVLSTLHVRRIQADMERAARDRLCYHLWCHPHNLGRHVEANLAQLDRILSTFALLRDRYGMISTRMADLAAATPDHA